MKYSGHTDVYSIKSVLNRILSQLLSTDDESAKRRRFKGSHERKPCYKEEYTKNTKDNGTKLIKMKKANRYSL